MGVPFTCTASPVQVWRGGRMIWRGTGSSVCTRNERTGQANRLSMDLEQCRPRTAVASRVHFGRRGHWAHRGCHVILSAVFVCFSTQLLHWSILAIYTTKTNASLNNNSLFLFAHQPHWYITCFPLRPLACLWFDASPLGVEGPESPLPPHAFTGVLLLLCLITPAPE